MKHIYNISEFLEEKKTTLLAWKSPKDYLTTIGAVLAILAIHCGSIPIMHGWLCLLSCVYRISSYGTGADNEDSMCPPYQHKSIISQWCLLGTYQGTRYLAC